MFLRRWFQIVDAVAALQQKYKKPHVIQYLSTIMQINVLANLSAGVHFSTKRMKTQAVRCENPNYFRFAAVITTVMPWGAWSIYT